MTARLLAPALLAFASLGCSSIETPEREGLSSLKKPAPDPYALKISPPLFGVGSHTFNTEAWPKTPINDTSPYRFVREALPDSSHAKHVHLVERFLQVPSFGTMDRVLQISDLLRFRGDAIEAEGPGDQTRLLERFLADRDRFREQPIQLEAVLVEHEVPLVYDDWGLWGNQTTLTAVGTLPTIRAPDQVHLWDTLSLKDATPLRKTLAGEEIDSQTRFWIDMVAAQATHVDEPEPLLVIQAKGRLELRRFKSFMGEGTIPFTIRGVLRRNEILALSFWPNEGDTFATLFLRWRVSA